MLPDSIQHVCLGPAHFRQVSRLKSLKVCRRARAVKTQIAAMTMRTPMASMSLFIGLDVFQPESEGPGGIMSRRLHTQQRSGPDGYGSP